MEPRLSRRHHLAYGVADIGGTLTFVTLNTWLLYFLVNVGGLEPLRAGAVFVAGRLFDALLDPPMGLLSDRFKRQPGRLVFIRWGALPLGASFALLWLLPADPIADPTATFLRALLAFLLFSLCYTVVQVPYMALTPELAPDYDERTRLSSYRIGFSVLASLAAVALPPLLVGAASPGPLAGSAPQGWLFMGVLFGALSALSFLAMSLSLREPARRDDSSAGQSSAGNAAPTFAAYRSAFAIHGFGAVFVLFIVVTVGLTLVNALLPFYLESALRLTNAQQSLVLGGLFGVAVLAFPLWNRLAERWGKRGALALGLGLLALALLLIVALVPSGRVSPQLGLLVLVAGFGLSAVMLFPWAMLPDVVEFGELQHGLRREGLVYALFTFGQKLAGSVGVFAGAIVASVFGYQQGAVEQAPETVRGVALATGPLAASVFACALVLALRFPITRASHAAARARLRAGNGSLQKDGLR